MEHQETKFSFVYNEVKQRILNGQVLPGNSLPSSRMLCDQYHVSRYTVNRVFDALKKDGLIEIQPRLAPVVLDGEKMPGSEHILRDILKKREGLVQIYRTWTLILPPLLVFATQNCSLEMMPHYKQAMRVSRIGVAAGGWRAFSAFDRDVLKIGGSPLLCDLYSTFELYHDLTFFTEQCSCFYDFFPRGSVPFAGVIMDIMKDTDPVVKHGRLTALYQRLTSSIECTLKHLAETAPDCPPPSEAAFSWRPLRGKDYFYMRIISDLNQKIGSGEYPRRTYLLHEKALAGQYGVSVSTVRKALAELEQRGFVKTLNGKGTVVIEPDSSRVSQVIFSSRRTEEAMRYLQALQLLVLIIHPAALSAAPLFAAKELDELDGKFAMPDSICIVEIVEAILKHVELEPLRIVLAETFRLTEWGYYIAYYTDRRQALEDLNGRVAASVQYLRAGDAASFADSIADCYRHVLKRAKVYMLENYNFYKAASVRIPEKY